MRWLRTRGGLAPSSIHHLVVDVGTCLRWLRRAGEIHAVPDLPQVRVPEHAPRIPSPETQDAILTAIPEAARGIFMACGYMGLRLSEARALEVGDYSFSERRLTVSKTKTRRVRVLPADPDVAAWIEAHVPQAGRLEAQPLFRNPGTGGPWYASSMRRVWDRACAEVGARIPMNEGGRHAFATHAVSRGVELYRVQKFLGHSDPRTTQRYAKLAGHGLLDVLRRRKPGPKRP